MCEFVNTLLLHDLPLLGVSFTFFGSGQNVARSRIDRFLVFAGTRSWSCNLIQNVVFRFDSNRILIIASSEDMPRGMHSFRFFNVWCQDAELKDLVEKLWEESSLSQASFWEKLKKTKVVVCRWQKSKHAWAANRIRACEEELGSLLNIASPSNMVELDSVSAKKMRSFDRAS